MTSEIDDWTGKIHQGDAVEVMEEMPEKSIHSIITSPPYWNIKNYQNENQIGHGDSLDEYIDRLGDVWKQCERVLHDGCRIAINIGDEYQSGNGEVPYHIVPLNSLIVSNIAKNTELYFLGSIIWQKISNTETSGGAPVMGSYGRPRNGYVSYDYEYINLFKKPGDDPPVTDEIKERSSIEKEDWMEYFSGHWQFPGKRQCDHPAPFPEELPRRLIKMFTFEEDVVLDPFIGSGTTAVAAEKMNRQWVGVDLNDSYVETSQKRLMKETGYGVNPISQW